MDWHARWIWEDGAARPRDRYVYFRREMDLPAIAPSGARARACADSRYKLWVNGAFVCHGPARCDARHVCYDEPILDGLLRPGRNAVAALVSFPGIGTCAAMVGRPGFLFQCRMEHEAGETVMATNAEWRCLAAPYVPGADRMSIQLPFPEDFDACAEPEGWTEPGFDDSRWRPAFEVSDAEGGLWQGLRPRDIPLPAYRAGPAARLFYAARRVARADPARPGETPAEAMARATHLAPANDGAVAPAPDGTLTIAPTPPGAGLSIALDLGREVSGFAWLEADAASEMCVEVGYSERVEDDGTVNPDHFGGCDVHYADRVRLRPGRQRCESFHPRALRYMRLDFREVPKPLVVRCGVQTSGYPVEPRGAFECSDALLNRIWEVGRETAALCMDDAFMDCPWRERGQWLADARVQALVAAYAFGDHALARRAWIQFAESQQALDAFDGGAAPPPHHAEPWIKGLYPAAPPFDTVLPTFSCIWLSAAWEHFLLTADQALLGVLWPAVDRLVRLLATKESPDGLLHNLPGWVFVDWAQLDTRGEATHVNAFYYAGLRAAARIARAVGRRDRGEDLDLRAAGVRDAVNDLLWNTARGVYADARVDGALSTVVSEQANLLCVATGLAEPEQAARVLEAFGGGAAPEGSVRIGTPYFAFYRMRALYAAGRDAEALDDTRREWGRMLARGATAFWEQYEPRWSLCHAWSAAPTYDLPAEVAGIRPLQPGFEEFTVHPRPADLTWMRAVVPTVRGDIRLAWHQRTDRPFVDAMGAAVPPAHTEPAIALYLTVPRGARAHVALPVHGVTDPVIGINGAILFARGARADALGARHLSVEDGMLRFEAPPGRFDVEVRRGGP